MWSRNGRPVAALIRPRPATSTFAVRRVSLLLRATSPFLLLKAYLDCMRVRAQPFHRRKPHAGIPKHLQITPIQAEDACALQEGVDAQRRSEPGCARGR